MRLVGFVAVAALLLAESVQHLVSDSNGFDVSQFMSGTKADLARSFFSPKLRKKDLMKVNVRKKENVDIKFVGSDRSAALFRRSKDNFIINGSQILKIQQHSDYYFLDSVQEYSPDQGTVAFQQIEWKSLFFLVVCYGNNYCRAMISQSVTNIAFQQKFSMESTPVDVEFFLDDETLFLIIAGDACKIYRWTGAYFDEHEELETSGASSVTTFRSGDSMVIVVAQNLEMKQTYSKVFMRRNKRTELIQMLDTRDASGVLSYGLESGGETSNFIFVLSNGNESSIFWWNGREFSLWKRVHQIIGPGRIFIRKLLSDYFFFFAVQNKLAIYHVTEMSFDFVHLLELDADILDLDLREEIDRFPMLLLLLKPTLLQPLLTITILPIEINYIPPTDNHVTLDPILQCVFQLERLLNDRELKFNESAVLSDEIGKNRKIIELERLTIPHVELKKFKINKLFVNPGKEKLQATPSEILKLFQNLIEEYNVVLPKLESLRKQVRYRFHGDILVDRMRALNIYANKFNDRNFNLDNIISITRNQTLSGAIRLKTLTTNSLTLPSINGLYIKELLVRNKTVQEITGEYTVRSIKARNVVFGKLGKLNGTLFAGNGKAGDERGNVLPLKKALPRVTLRQMQVDYINNEPAEQWLAKILPTTADFQPEQPLNFTNLKVNRLVVNKINGEDWRNYLMKLKGATRMGKESESHTHWQRLIANKINGVETDFFLTKDTPQNVQSQIKAISASTLASIKVNHFKRDHPHVNTNLPNITVSHIIFTNPPNISGKITNFDNINETYWLINSFQEVNASVTFSNQVTVKNMEALRINNVSADAFVTIDDERKPLKNKFVFKNATVFGNVETNGKARSNVHLEKLYASAVKANRDNFINGKKLFSGKVSAQKISLQSVNGNPFQNSHPLATGILRGKIFEIIGNVSAKNGIILNYLNNRNFNAIINDHVRLDEANVLEKANFTTLSVREIEMENINGIGNDSRFRKIPNTNNNNENKKKIKIVIAGDLRVPKIHLNTVNDIPFNEYFNKVVLRNGSTLILRGRKHFHETTTITGNLNGSLNDYHLPELEKIALSKSKAQNVTGPFTVDVLTANNAHVHMLDGVLTENLLFEEEPIQKVIRSHLIFTHLAVAGNLDAHNFLDGCDFSKISAINVKEMKRLGKVDVMGNVTWRREGGKERGKSISYLLKNSVTKHQEQVITASVRFHQNVRIQKITTKSNVNNVDFQFIVKDAVYHSFPVQEIFHDVTFRGKVTAKSILIENNAIIDNINGVDVLEFGEKLVKNSADTEVRGKKKFLPGFTTLHLKADAVNGVKTEPIIFCEGDSTRENIHLPPSNFTSVKILKDLTVMRVNNVHFSQFLNDRLSISENQQLVNATLTVDAPVIIKGDSGITHINRLKLESTVLISGEADAKSIRGTIQFNNSMRTPEKVILTTLNNRNLKKIKEQALVDVKKSLVHGNIIFVEDVEIRGNLDAAKISGPYEKCQIKRAPLPTDIASADSYYAAKIHLEIDKIENDYASFIKPIVFIYLQERATVNVSLSKLEKITAKHNDDDSIEFNFYGSGDGEKCDYPHGCLCRMQNKFIIFSSILQFSNPETVFFNQYNYFHHYLNMEININLFSSNNSRCEDVTGDPVEYGQMSWRRRKESGSNQANMLPWTHENSINFTGRLSDVKFFTIGESLFALIAFYIRPREKQMSRLKVMVYEFDGRRDLMKKIQEMEMKGVEKMDLFWTPKGMVFVAGNGYDSENFSDFIESAIYRFNDSNNQFELLRSVKTHGIADIASVTGETDNFIFLVQKNSWPVIIFKYNHKYDNYYFSQKLYPDHTSFKSKITFLSAAAFTTARSGYEGDIFVGIVHSEGGFHLFKYKHIEGFVEELRQEQKNLETITPFQINFRQYLLATSSGNDSLIYELVQQGNYLSNY